MRKMLSEMVDADIKRNGTLSSFMIRAGLMREILDNEDSLQSEVKVLREALERRDYYLKSINRLIGNVDHGRGHGPQAAAMRGDMLNDIRDIVTAALSSTGEG